MIEHPYDDVCNDEPWRAPLTAAESAELKGLTEEFYNAFSRGLVMPKERTARRRALATQLFLYGDSTVEAKSFEGLLPRSARQVYRTPLTTTDDNGNTFVWYVSWGEEFQMPEYDPARPRPSIWRSLKWRAQGWRWWWSDLVLEAAYRIRKAWRALRHG